MANDLNQCNFIGRLGSDVDTRYMPSGEAVSTISLAVGWKSKDKEGCEWVRVVAFGKLAENVATYLKKGSKVFVTGRYRTQKWNKDGVDQYRTEIVANDMQFLDGKPQESTPAPKQQHKPAQQPAFDDDFADSDIPF